MDPIIYYRLSKPAQSLEKLPSLDSNQLFEKDDEGAQIAITVKNAVISPKEVDDLQLKSEDIGSRLREIESFTQEDDMKIVCNLNEKLRFGGDMKIEDLKPHMIEVDKDKVELMHKDQQALNSRSDLIINYSKSFY